MKSPLLASWLRPILAPLITSAPDFHEAGGFVPVNRFPAWYVYSVLKSQETEQVPFVLNTADLKLQTSCNRHSHLLPLSSQAVALSKHTVNLL